MNDWQSLRPAWGIVLGSGLGSLIDRMEIECTVSYADLPELPQSSVPGHAGRFVFGKLAGIPIVCAQGRVHLYEGRTAVEVASFVRWMHALHVPRIILTNAAGTANPAFEPGRWMMLTDHLNLTGTTPLLGSAHFIDMSEVYSARLRRHFARSAEDADILLHEGVYSGGLGPQYETPAEVRMLQRLGADAVGMSTVLEAIQARALGMEVAGFSCLTNWAAGLSPHPLAHEEVLTMGTRAASHLADLLERALPTA